MTTRAPATIERLPVKTLAAEKRDLEVTLPVFGTITYLDKVEVASEVQGVLKAVPVEAGDRVKKGQVLAVLDTELSAERFTGPHCHDRPRPRHSSRTPPGSMRPRKSSTGWGAPP